MYQRVTVATGQPVGDPGDLPPELVGLTDVSLADLSAALDPVPEAYAGQGFIPFTPPPGPPPIPQQVSMRQARLALLSAGLYDQVTTAINGADAATKIWWDTSPVIERDNAVLAAVQTTLGLTSAQVDALFISAAALP